MAGAPGSPSPLRVRFGEFELDEANALLLRGGSAIALSPTPFGLLCALVRHPGSLLTKHALLDEVWGHRFVSDSVLKGTISDIRTVLDDDPRSPRFIETVPRRGYRFIANPTALQEPAARNRVAAAHRAERSRRIVGRDPRARRALSSAAPRCSRAFAVLGSARPGEFARSLGSPASPGSARRRLSSTLPRVSATSRVGAAIACSSSGRASRTKPC